MTKQQRDGVVKVIALVVTIGLASLAAVKSYGNLEARVIYNSHAIDTKADVQMVRDLMERNTRDHEKIERIQMQILERLPR